MGLVSYVSEQQLWFGQEMGVVLSVAMGRTPEREKVWRVAVLGVGKDRTIWPKGERLERWRASGKI